jgi:hypothetical protein
MAFSINRINDIINKYLHDGTGAQIVDTDDIVVSDEHYYYMKDDNSESIVCVDRITDEYIIFKQLWYFISQQNFRIYSEPKIVSIPINRFMRQISIETQVFKSIGLVPVPLLPINNIINNINTPIINDINTPIINDITNLYQQTNQLEQHRQQIIQFIQSNNSTQDTEPSQFTHSHISMRTREPPTIPIPSDQITQVAEEVKEDVDYSDDVTCTICMTNKKTFVLVPCGHMFCPDCVNRVTNKCFICRKTITKKIQTF